MSLTIKKSKRNGYTNYNVIHLEVLHQTACVRACCFRPNFKPATKAPLVYVLHPLFHVRRTLLPMSQPSDCATTTSSACKVNSTIDYPVNEMKKTLARYIACGVDELTKLRCYGCEKDHPSQRQHDCFLPEDILIDIYFDEALEKVNSTAVIRDLLTLLLEVNLTQSDVAPEQLNAAKSWLEEYPSEQWGNNVKRMILAP